MTVMGRDCLDAQNYKAMPFKYKLARFTLHLRKAYPFLGEVCMRVEKYRKDTFALAATDGYRLYLNEDKLDKLPEESLNLLHWIQNNVPCRSTVNIYGDAKDVVDTFNNNRNRAFYGHLATLYDMRLSYIPREQNQDAHKLARGK